VTRLARLALCWDVVAPHSGVDKKADQAADVVTGIQADTGAPPRTDSPSG